MQEIRIGGEKIFSILNYWGYRRSFGKKLKTPCDVVLCPKAHTSSAEDTKLCAQIMKEQGVVFLVFCGGGWDQREFCEAVEA